jgi:hypothetical protein
MTHDCDQCVRIPRYAIYRTHDYQMHRVSQTDVRDTAKIRAISYAHTHAATLRPAFVEVIDNQTACIVLICGFASDGAFFCSDIARIRE